MLNEFTDWFDKDSPNFNGKYGSLMSFYDKQADEFQIQEIQDAYEQFKNGEVPNGLFLLWGGR